MTSEHAGLRAPRQQQANVGHSELREGTAREGSGIRVSQDGTRARHHPNPRWELWVPSRRVLLAPVFYTRLPAPRCACAASPPSPKCYAASPLRFKLCRVVPCVPQCVLCRDSQDLMGGGAQLAEPSPSLHGAPEPSGPLPPPPEGSVLEQRWGTGAHGIPRSGLAQAPQADFNPIVGPQ